MAIKLVIHHCSVSTVCKMLAFLHEGLEEDNCQDVQKGEGIEVKTGDGSGG